MIIPGGLLLGSVLLCFDGIPFVKTLPDWASGVLFVVISYVIGIINHQFTELIWASFRNNPIDVKAWNDAVFVNKSVKYFSRYILIITGVYCLISFLVLMCIKFMICRWVLGVAALMLLLLAHNTTFPYGRIDESIIEYYKKYYFVETRRKNANISVLESQVSFLKSLCLPLCIFTVILLCFPEKTGVDNSVVLFIGLILLVLLIRTTFIKQGNIYRIVFEDYKYLREV